jgi:glyoxylase-like metal-dependent hydrolase (beta-lactamase superfamily II)
MSGKGTFTTFALTGEAKVHRIPLEAFPDFWVYGYVLQAGQYCILIDTGSGSDTSHENLLSGFQQAGIEFSDLTHILLTHAHIDHFGGLANLRPLIRAKIGCHELDVQAVTQHETRLAVNGQRLASFLAETGLAEETREQILSLHRFSKTLYQSISVDFTYEALGMRLGPLEFIHLPGHCPGHVAIRLDDVIFCGDMVVRGVTPHLAPESIHAYSGLDHYLESLARFQHWAQPARLIFNGHDDVITDLTAEIAATKQNIARRVRRAVKALREPLTISEVCQAVYGDMGGYNQLLVIEKTGAYVEYLYKHGMIEVANSEEVQQGEPPRYRRLQDEVTTIAELEKHVYKHTRIQVDI